MNAANRNPANTNDANMPHEATQGDTVRADSNGARAHINVHIERLILDGLPLDRRQAVGVQAAVEAELIRLLTAGGLAMEPTGMAVPTLSGGALQITGSHDPLQLGMQVAQAVYAGIGGGTQERGTRNGSRHEAPAPKSNGQEGGGGR